MYPVLIGLLILSVQILAYLLIRGAALFEREAVAVDEDDGVLAGVRS